MLLLHHHHPRAALKAHPDKGGDPAIFRLVQTSFEVLAQFKLLSNVTSQMRI
jgi:hypothetical protein